ncbi:uncharacterized protein [Glycine max]|uniref:uncharacterized protein n=1 Tax=Glycine max TaxID=3847 RepID=UPI000E21BF62|nr:uncharacterized protein LOC112999618 [Glycine max]|eukprot:XP_025981730.1 uncharacterized protein LOC112999618 [Glycine max]
MVFVASATNVSAQVNNIPMLNETNFKVWKEAVEIVLGYMDLDLALRTERPTSTPEASNEYFAKNEKAETSNLLAKLFSKKYKGKSNIREYIMEMSNLASKLKALKLELGEDMFLHLILISLPAHFGQFKVSYNTQKEKWSLNELISHCVQKEERLQRDRPESAHLSSTSQNRKRKKNKGDAEGSSQQKNQRRMRNLPTTFARSLDT